MTGDTIDKLEFTKVENNLLEIYNSFSIKCGLKSCVLYNKSKNEGEKQNEFYLWGRFSNEDFENFDDENYTFPFSYKNFPLKNKIKKLSCGDTHLLLIDSKGNFFSMGKGENGELGLGEKILIADTPTKLNFHKDNQVEVSNEKIKFIDCYCGMRSSFAITSEL